MACLASELADHLILEIPSHGAVCLTVLEADDDVHYEREFRQATQAAAAAVAEPEVRVVRRGADRAVHAAGGRREVADRPDHGDHDLPHWSSDASALWVRLPQYLMEEVAQLRDRSAQRTVSLPPPRRIRFHPGIDIAQGAGKVWLDNLFKLIQLLDDRPFDQIAPHRLNALRRRLITRLLSAARA